jgi:hypothetical protein
MSRRPRALWILGSFLVLLAAAVAWLLYIYSAPYGFAGLGGADYVGSLSEEDAMFLGEDWRENLGPASGNRPFDAFLLAPDEFNPTTLRKQEGCQAAGGEQELSLECEDGRYLRATSLDDHTIVVVRGQERGSAWEDIKRWWVRRSHGAP